jgi:MSHA biogenesis protein MshP
MCPEKRKPMPPCVAQRAFALPTAIFLLVVLAALGAFMLMISSVQHTTSAQDVQGTRAYLAARTGVEWGGYQVMAPENQNYGRTSGYTTPYACPGVMTAALPNLGGTLAGFQVAVACTQSTHDEGGDTVRVYQITSTAALGAVGAVARVERRIQATVSTCRQASGANCE